MRFDWYQATVGERPQVLVDELLARLGQGGKVLEGRGRYNYRQSATVLDARGEKIAVVLYGGSNGDPNVAASSDACDAFVPVFRELWPDHLPTRLDAAEDFESEGAYELLEGVCRAVTAEHRVKGIAFVPDDPADGRTYRMGAPSSDVFARLYDKAAERRKALPAELHGTIPQHLTRLEAVCRPPKEWRDFAARWEPETVFAASAWTHDLAERAMGLQLQRTMCRLKRQTDHERAYRAVLDQYARTFQRLLEDHGSWAAVGAQIGSDLERLGLLGPRKRRRRV